MLGKSCSPRGETRGDRESHDVVSFPDLCMLGFEFDFVGGGGGSSTGAALVSKKLGKLAVCTIDGGCASSRGDFLFLS